MARLRLAAGVAAALAVAAAQETCRTFQEAHPALAHSCSLTIPALEQNFRSPVTSTTAFLCEAPCALTVNQPLVRQLINYGCSVNYSNRTAGDLNEMMESVTGFMCVKNNNGTRCMDSLPLGCTPLNVSETAQCSNFSAALDSMGCCGGSFISASQSFNETGLAETCLGNTRTAIVGRLQLCNVSHHDPCAVPTPSPTLAPSTRVTTTPRAVATTTSADDDVNGGGGSGTTRLNTGTDVGIALAVVVFVLGVLGGGVLYFHVHKRHLEAEGYTFGDDADEDNAGLLLRDTSDVYASSGAYDG